MEAPGKKQKAGRAARQATQSSPSKKASTTTTITTTTTIAKQNQTETEWMDRILLRSKMGPLANFDIPKTIAIQFIQLHKIGMSELAPIVLLPSKQQFVVAEHIVSRLTLAFLQLPKSIRRSKVVKERGMNPLFLSTEQNVLSFIFNTIAKNLILIFSGRGDGDPLESRLLPSVQVILDRVRLGKYFEKKAFPGEALREFEFDLMNVFLLPQQTDLNISNRHVRMCMDVLEEVHLIFEKTSAAGGGCILSTSSLHTLQRHVDYEERISTQSEGERVRKLLKRIQCEVTDLNGRIEQVVDALKKKFAEPLSDL